LNLWKGHRRYREDRVDLHSGLRRDRNVELRCQQSFQLRPFQ
jgi:hypothetical protein